MYENEKEIGRAIKDSSVPREEIFIITKLYPNQYDNPEEAIEIAFEKLGVDYIDMMLLHNPGTNDVKAYKVIEKYVQKGKIRSIGLSNWYVEDKKLDKLTEKSKKFNQLEWVRLMNNYKNMTEEVVLHELIYN